MKLFKKSFSKRRTVFHSIETAEVRVLLSAAGTVHLVDAGDSGFSEQGAWLDLSNNGYWALNGDFQLHHAGAGTATAKWEFDSLEEGWYDVASTWVAQGNRSANVQYEIHDGLQFEATVGVNQQLTPDGDYWDTQRWESLGQFYVSSGDLTVEMQNDLSGIVVADAIRLVRLPEIELLTANGDVVSTWNAESSTAITLTAGELTTITLRVINTSETPLTLRGVSTNSELLKVTQGQQWTTLTVGESLDVAFDIFSTQVGQVEAAVLFEFTGEVTTQLEVNLELDVVPSIASHQLDIVNLMTNDADGGVVNFPDSYQNQLSSVTLLVTNSGDSPIEFSDNLAIPWGYEVLSQSGEWVSGEVNDVLPSQLQVSGDSFLLTLRSSAATGQKTGTVRLNTADGTQLASIQLNSQVQAGFVLDEPQGSGWEYRQRSYFTSVDQDFSYAQSHWDATETEWVATDLAAGTYRVWTTWLAGSNRATDAMYSVQSGPHKRNTFVNQQLSPNGVDDWQVIGTANVTDGTLSVTLSNQASSGIVVADAVWIEPMTFADAQVVIIDDGGAGYSESGVHWFERSASWLPTVEQDFRYAGAYWSATTSQWTFDDLSAGTWEVFATWLPGGNRAIDVQYGLEVGDAQHSALVNQQLSPDDLTLDQQNWEGIGTVNLSTEASLTVSLSNLVSSGIVVADAMMVRRVDTSVVTSLPVQLNQSQFRSGDIVQVAAANADLGEYRFWLKSETGWSLEQRGTSSLWETELPAGSYTAKVEFLHQGSTQSVTSSGLIEFEVRESESELWDRVITPYLQDELWDFEYRYDAANFLMVPLVDAFQSGDVARQVQFQEHFARLAEHGADSNGERGDLSWLQYLSLASRFVSEASLAARQELVQPELLDLLSTELERYWLDAPAFHWVEPAFAGMKQRVEWKLSVDPATLSQSFHNAIIDHETFVMNIAADLKTFERITGESLAGTVVEDIIEVTREVFEQRGMWEGERWLFQIGYWDDHIDFAYAGNSHITPQITEKPVENVAPDSAHAHRVPALLKSLINTDPQDSYYATVLAGAEQQFYQRVLVTPDSTFDGYRLTNYMDGSNGVYRYGSLFEGNDGYDPYELSGRLLYGWWTFLDSNRIRTVYQNISESFGLGEEVIEMYTGPNDTRITHPQTKLPDAYSSGFLELATLLASRV